MSDLARWSLAIFLGVFIGGVLKLAFRNATINQRLNVIRYPTEVSIAINVQALRQITSIGTPVFLGWAITHVFPEKEEILHRSQVFAIAGAIAYIFWWLWMQRVPAADFEVISKRRVSGGKPIPWMSRLWSLTGSILGLASMYCGWFVLAIGSPLFAPTLAVFCVDLLFQFLIIGGLWRLGGKIGSGPGVTHGKWPSV